MRYHQLILIAILGCIGLLGTSCKKDIEIDYHQVEPLYVVEASVSNDGMEARISQTNNMDDNSTQSDISQAKVMITGTTRRMVKMWNVLMKKFRLRSLIHGHG